MRKAFYLSALLLLCSCCSHRYAQNDLVGAYSGFNSGSRYNLALVDDSVFMFFKYFDIYMIRGFGKWTIRGRYVVLEYENPPLNFYTAIKAGSYWDGTDSLRICNANKLKFKRKKEKVTLFKKLDTIPNRQHPYYYLFLEQSIRWI